MAIKVPQASSLVMLTVLETGDLDPAILRLYTNDYSPVNTSVVGNFTEATFPGYASISLTTKWSVASINVDGKAEVACPVQTFTAGVVLVPQNVYGIFVTRVADGSLVYAERNPSGLVVIAALGQTYSYLPRVTLKSEF